MEESKPCPFCGMLPEYRKDFPTGKLHTISCENEECKIHPYALGKSKNEAIEKWNHRAN